MNVVESRKARVMRYHVTIKYYYEVFMYNVSMLRMSYNIVCSLASCFQL